MIRYSVTVREFTFWFEAPQHIEQETLSELTRAHAATYVLQPDNPVGIEVHS